MEHYENMFNTVHEMGLVEESARVDLFSISAPKKKKPLRFATNSGITIGYSFNRRRLTDMSQLTHIL